MKPATFTRINLIASLLVMALLLFLFIYPHVLLSELEETVCTNLEAVILAIKAGEWDAAHAGIRVADDAFQGKKNTLKLFLDHEDLDDLEATLNGCKQLIDMEEDQQVLSELEHAINIATYLRGIETFTLYNLF